MELAQIHHWPDHAHELHLMFWAPIQPSIALINPIATLVDIIKFIHKIRGEINYLYISFKIILFLKIAFRVKETRRSLLSSYWYVLHGIRAQIGFAVICPGQYRVS